MSRLFIIIALSQMVNIMVHDFDNKHQPKYVCLNGKDPGKLTRKEILKEFAKGRCSPVVILSGLLGNKMTVDIDCQQLKIHHPELFTYCGWTHCEKQSFEIWKKVPEKEYLLWVPELLGPFNMLSLTEKTNKCWAGFIKLAVDFTKPISEAVKETKGFEVKFYGSSDNTKGKSKCGDMIMSEIGPNSIQTRSSNLFKDFMNVLKEMGYVAGLTYQAIPYDYRLPLGSNGLSKTFEPNISRLHKLTGKKVVIIANSFGNSNVHTELLKLDQDYKDEKIKAWIGIGAALLGVNKSLRVLVGGEPEMSFVNRMLGLHFRPGVEAFNNFLSMYDMFPLNPFRLYKNEDWLKAVIKRMKYENGQLPFEDSGFKFLPKTTDKCSPDNFTRFSTSCKLGLKDHTGDYVVKIKNRTYSIDQIKDLVAEYDYTGQQLNFYEFRRKNNIERIESPGVPYIAITMRTASTAYKYDFTEDPWDNFNRNVYPEPSTTTGYGDGTVESNSLFILGLKWAYEYDQGVKNARPVKFVDVCSTYNVKYNVYDKTDFDKPFEILNNEFMGIECDCMKDPTTRNCVHEFLIQDTSTLRLYSNVLITNEITYTEDHDIYIESLDDTYLEMMTTSCPQITAISTQPNIETYCPDPKEV